MSLWRSLLSLLPLAGGLSWDPLKPQTSVPDHGHPFGDLSIDTPSLVQLAEALGGGVYPGLGSGQNDTVTAVDSVAPSFPLNMNFLLPANQVKLQAVRLSFQPGAFRTYYSATQHTHAGDTVANEATHTHGGDTVQTLSITINTGTGHQHKLLAASSGAPVSTASPFNYQNASGTNHLVGLLSDTLEDIWSGVNSDATSAGGATGHGHSNASHTHTPGTTGSGQTHTHTPGTTGANNPASGVQEGTSPDNMRVLVDGTDVTTQLGGPWNTAQTEIDVTPYVAPGTGYHIVQVTTTNNLGRISGAVRFKGIVNNLSTAA